MADPQGPPDVRDELDPGCDLLPEIGVAPGVEGCAHLERGGGFQRTQHVLPHPAGGPDDGDASHARHKPARAASSWSRLAFCISVRGSRSVGLGMRPSTASAVLTGIGLVSLKSALMTGSSS